MCDAFFSTSSQQKIVWLREEWFQLLLKLAMEGVGGNQEDVARPFLHSDFFQSNLDHCFWLVWLIYRCSVSYFRSFKSFWILRSFFNRTCGIIHLIWSSIVWVLCKERNPRIFKNTDELIHYLLDNIKAQTFRWLKVKQNNFAFDYHMCRLNPFQFLYGFSLFFLAYRMM